jgi:polyisoprenoid-binding protein YceI
MKKSGILIFTLAAFALCGYRITNSWNVVPEGAIINFELPDEGTKGTFGGLKATIDFDAKDPSAVNTNIVASIDISTLNSGNQQKDKHLLSPDFFDAEKYPTATFKCSTVGWGLAPDNGKSANAYIAKGTLSIKDSTKNVEIPFTFDQDANGGSFKGTLTVFSSDYGITKKSKSGKDKVVVTIIVPVKR